jgi:Rps23 Pro-64 3,4-dihydroxylase Tpa1-like proline 4-hydroxylase
MINFEQLEAKKEQLRNDFLNAKPFPHIAIDHFCDEEEINQLVAEIPEVQTRAADYAFSKNKYEKSKIKGISPRFEAFYNDITSQRFQDLIKYITNEDVFIDADLYGGGIHQGREGSFLDMHADFNYHPLKPTWFRNLNLLLYLNKDWKPEYGGNLKLEDSRTRVKTEVEVPFNRLAIMHCRGYTLHGYDPISFPVGTARTSIAMYAYTIHEKQLELARTTLWKVKKDKPLKYLLSKIWVPAVRIKSLFTKSNTANH